jgi:cytochrome oxidase Cu insertion factor (SCO1/SenC/PrrC family)
MSLRATALLLTGVLSVSCAPSGPLSFAWPPVVDETYPDLELTDFRGEVVRLSSFKGRVLLIEPIGMT